MTQYLSSYFYTQEEEDTFFKTFNPDFVVMETPPYKKTTLRFPELFDSEEEEKEVFEWLFSNDFEPRFVTGIRVPADSKVARLQTSLQSGFLKGFTREIPRLPIPIPELAPPEWLEYYRFDNFLESDKFHIDSNND